MAEHPGGIIDLSQTTVGRYRDGTTQLIPNTAGPPERIDGVTIGAPFLSGPPPHAGEMHPDGDEILYLVSGRIDVILEEQGTKRTLELHPGCGCIVPRGVWHQVLPRERSQLVHVTPGPGGEHRPL